MNTGHTALKNRTSLKYTWYAGYRERYPIINWSLRYMLDLFYYLCFVSRFMPNRLIPSWKTKSLCYYWACLALKTRWTRVTDKLGCYLHWEIKCKQAHMQPSQGACSPGCVWGTQKLASVRYQAVMRCFRGQYHLLLVSESFLYQTEILSPPGMNRQTEVTWAWWKTSQ